MTSPGEPDQKGLKKNAITFISNVVIGVASTAPGYSLAATLGFVTAIAGIGMGAPAVMLVAFIPMLFIALAYNYMNRADPDCGTTFTWVTRAMGPSAGLAGRLGDHRGRRDRDGEPLADRRHLHLPAVRLDKRGELELRDHRSRSDLDRRDDVDLLAGIELSARTQQFLLGMEFVTLVVFAIVALITVYVNHPHGSIEPQASWFNPFSLGITPLINGVLLAVFIYWGWDTCVTVNEETEDAGRAPGRAAVVSTLMLLGIYLW